MIGFAGIGKVFLVGDIHGMFPPFQAFARRVQGRGVAVVQIGDFGHGFLDRPTAAGVEDFFREHANTCGFIRGNHDDPAGTSCSWAARSRSTGSIVLKALTVCQTTSARSRN